MICPFRTTPEIFHEPKGIFDRLGKIRTGIGIIEIMGGARIKTLTDNCPFLAAIDQRQYRNTALCGGSRKLCDRLQTLCLSPADVDHCDHRAGCEKPGSQIVESARSMNPPSEGRNFCGQRVTLVNRKQEQVPEFD